MKHPRPVIGATILVTSGAAVIFMAALIYLNRTPTCNSVVTVRNHLCVLGGNNG